MEKCYVCQQMVKKEIVSNKKGNNVYSIYVGIEKDIILKKINETIAGLKDQSHLNTFDRGKISGLNILSKEIQKMKEQTNE